MAYCYILLTFKLQERGYKLMNKFSILWGCNIFWWVKRDLTLSFFCSVFRPLCVRNSSMKHFTYQFIKREKKAVYISKLKIMCIISDTSISRYDHSWGVMIFLLCSWHTFTGQLSELEIAISHDRCHLAWVCPHWMLISEE